MKIEKYAIKPIVIICGISILLITLLSHGSIAQVSLRDTTISWQHHRFELNADGSMKTFTTDDSDIEQVSFTQAKVIENELIRLVIIPEYGGRILSFFYKPTQHEYLYQSECGSPYGIGDGNFYYDWLMVYGGIFPTFPEPEHGKTWFLPWDFSIVKNTSDAVTIRMEYTDDTSYSGAPSGFNNGITNITCQIDVSVYKNSKVWDYDVNLINNKAETVNYEYWTCTSLTPGSETGNTGSPLNSEIIIPVDEYFAGWSPGGWIGNYDSRYDLSTIDHLSKWDDMGIAYAYNLDDIYWGTINHENEEGIFRISDNIETPGMKLWSWGKNHVDNDLFDFSNGGADNYIELWAGVSDAFFRDATLSPNQHKSWTESYSTTEGLLSILNMNDKAALNLIWNEADLSLTYQLNTFNVEDSYKLQLYIESPEMIEIANRTIVFAPLGITESISLIDLDLNLGEHVVRLELLDDSNQLVLEASKVINVSNILGYDELAVNDKMMTINSLGNYKLEILLTENDSYTLEVIGLSGHIIQKEAFSGSSVEAQLPGSGIYIVRIAGRNSSCKRKIFLNE